MFGWTVSEIVLYSGMGLVALALVLGAVVTVLQVRTGKKLQQKLKEEYG